MAPRNVIYVIIKLIIEISQAYLVCYVKTIQQKYNPLGEVQEQFLGKVGVRNRVASIEICNAASSSPESRRLLDKMK